MAKMMVDEIIVALVVRDVEAILDFYQNYLGMEMGWTAPMGDGGTQYFLKFENGILKIIAPSAKPEKKTGSLFEFTGYRILTFVVTNISEICEELEGKGVQFVTPIQTNDAGLTWAVLTNPEGNTIELAQRG